MFFCHLGVFYTVLLRAAWGGSVLLGLGAMVRLRLECSADSVFTVTAKKVGFSRQPGSKTSPSQALGRTFRALCLMVRQDEARNVTRLL